MKLLLVAVAGFILSASTGFAQPPTEIEALHKKLLQKYTVDDLFGGDKPKSFCICKDGERAGVLVSRISTGAVQEIIVQCFRLFADAGGTISGAVSCDDWIPLAK